MRSIHTPIWCLCTVMASVSVAADLSAQQRIALRKQAEAAFDRASLGDVVRATEEF